MNKEYFNGTTGENRIKLFRYLPDRAPGDYRTNLEPEKSTNSIVISPDFRNTEEFSNSIQKTDRKDNLFSWNNPQSRRNSKDLSRLNKREFCSTTCSESVNPSNYSYPTPQFEQDIVQNINNNFTKTRRRKGFSTHGTNTPKKISVKAVNLPVFKCNKKPDFNKSPARDVLEFNQNIECLRESLRYIRSRSLSITS